MNRRDLLKNLTVALFAAVPASESTWQTPEGPVDGLDPIYASIGVEPIIHCRGTFTIIGGSKELPEVTKAMVAASGYFVQYDELAMGVGKRLAELTKSAPESNARKRINGFISEPLNNYCVSIF